MKINSKEDKNIKHTVKGKKIEIRTNFYDSFRCIADRCSITCCQEWKIEVDDSTSQKWNSLKLYPQEEENLNHYVGKKDGIGIIALTEEKKCPFLNQDKLCNLVMKFGDEVLSKTCTIFPREIHEFEDRKECSLVTCCPEVVDILSRVGKVSFSTDLEAFQGDDLFQVRTLMLNILGDENFTSQQGLMMCFYLLLDISEKKDTSMDAWREYCDKGVQKHLADTIRNMEFHRLDTFEERNELFLDLAENYRKEGIYARYLEEIAVLAEEYADGYDEEKMTERLVMFETKFSEYEKLFRNYLVAEVFNNGLIPESDFTSMIVMLEWIAMEYAIIKHSIFLRWCREGCQEIVYEVVRDYIVILSRMTGYDEEDIREYLENSFQSLIWEWGYLALIVGNEM